MNDLLEEAHCPICGKAPYEVVRPAAYPAEVRRDELNAMYSSSSEEKLMDQMVRCKTCGMCYVTPRVRSDIVLDSYSQAKDKTHWEQSAPRVDSFRRNLQIALGVISLKPSRDIRILDIGSAGGYFLKAAQDLGLTATGIEPSVWLSETGRRQFGVDLRTGTLESGSFDPGSFSVASLWDVIEHVPDPAALLDKIHRLLIPKGHLFISYPDYGSWSARLLGEKWPFLLNVHLYYFTRKTITKLLAAHGFHVIFFKPYFQTLETGYILQRAGAVIPLLAPLQSLAHALGLDHRPIRYHVGQTLLVAQKN